ncbi:hypothetical protein MBLNU459_g1108t1 [Dothideomycetes sp. NU459]
MAIKSPSEQTILVTGASGFIAAHILTTFLTAGYKVRGTVRSESTAEKVRATHSRWGPSQLSFAIVPDIRTAGAFDEAVKGVDGVVHTASPVALGISDNERDLLQPAIKGTEGVLASVAEHAPGVRRVVVTSSFGAIIDPHRGARPGYVYSEKDWNPLTYEQTKNGSPLAAYAASKTLAERAAFDFVADKKPGFDVASVCPPVVYGPVEHSVTDLSKLNHSLLEIYALMDGSQKEIGATLFPVWADVRDVAAAHLKAYEVKEAGGERFAVTSGKFQFEQICDVLREEFPEIKDKVPKAVEGRQVLEMYTLSNEKAKKVLGIQFRSLEECIVDTARSLLELEKHAEKHVNE